MAAAATLALRELTDVEFPYFRDKLMSEKSKEMGATGTADEGDTFDMEISQQYRTRVLLNEPLLKVLAVPAAQRPVCGFVDVFWDTPDCALLKQNCWLVLRQPQLGFVNDPSLIYQPLPPGEDGWRLRMGAVKELEDSQPCLTWSEVRGEADIVRILNQRGILSKPGPKVDLAVLFPLIVMRLWTARITMGALRFDFSGWARFQGAEEKDGDFGIYGSCCFVSNECDEVLKQLRDFAVDLDQLKPAPSRVTLMLRKAAPKAYAIVAAGASETAAIDGLQAEAGTAARVKQLDGFVGLVHGARVNDEAFLKVGSEDDSDCELCEED